MDLFALTQPLRSRAWLGYVVALLLAAGALGIRLLIGPVLDGYPFLTFFPAVLLAAYLGGLGPGAACAVLSGLLALYYLIEPVRTLTLVWPGGWIAMAFYALVAGTIVALVHGMNSAYARLLVAERSQADLNAELEQRVAARTLELAESNEQLRAAMAARIEAEERAAQLQRLEAVGQLTGGVAHDFNNMLSIIVGNLDLAQRRLAGGSTDIVRFLDGAMDGARRGASLTARLLAFARRQPLTPAVTNVNGMVSGMSEMLKRTLGERIEIEAVLAGGLWLTCVDPGQLESAIVNLAVNARDAMPAGGKLTIETLNMHLDETYAAQHADVTPGQYVCVAVTDTGSGMSPEVADKAFEPFFTTKEVGRGTGLGLSQIFGYLKQSGGHAKIYSEIDRGTTVRLYFPRYEGAEQAIPRQETASAEAMLPPGRSDEIILVVEDEAGVRATTVEALSELGYTVRAAANGDSALRMLHDGPDVTLLLTDVVMPGMTGRELADKAVSLLPSLKVLYTTGYTRNAIVHGGRLDPGVELLTKPFTTDQLARKVRSLLG